MTDTLIDQLVRQLAQLERRVDDLVEPEVISNAAGGTGVTPQVTYWTGTKTIGGDPGLTYDAANDALSMLSAISTEPILELQNTNVDALSGSIQFYKNSATPADGDDIGAIGFYGETSTGAKERYAYMLAESDDITNGDTAGRFRLIMTMDAIERNMLDVDMYNGVVNQGTITFNAEGQDVDYYVESAGVADALFIRGSDGQITFGAYGPGYIYADAVGVLSTVVAPVPGPHDILGVSHSDAAVDAVTRGSLIYGNATPLWDELNHPGAANRVLQSAALDVQWSAQTLTLTTSLTNQGANGVLNWAGAFTLTIPATGTAVLGTGAANTLSYWSGINTQTNLANAAGYLNNNGAGVLSWVAAPAPAAHAILSASHSDAAVDAVTRGSIIVGNASPLWDELVIGPAATFLRSDGNDPSWAAIVAGDLPAHTHSGAGQGGSLVIGTTDTDATAGSVLFAGAAGVIQEDNANFFWDDGNNRLGLGDNTPDAPLDVYHATVDIVGFFESGDDIGGIKVADDDTTGYAYAADGYLFLGGDAAKAATNVVINTTTGFVGIGTVLPTYEVEVVSGSPIVALDITTTANYGIFLFQEAGVSVGSVQYMGSTFVTVARRENLEIYNISAVGGIAFHVNNSTTPSVFIDVAGNVGIGDTTPDTSLDVYHATTDIVAFFESGDDIGGIKVEDDDTAGYFYAADGNVYLGGDAAKAVTNLQINATTGYVGIGIAAPTETHLHVYDNTLTSAATFYGIRSYHIKTAGVGAAGDDYFGTYGLMGLNQATVIDNLYGGLFVGQLTLGTADTIFGVDGFADIDGGTASIFVAGGRHRAIIDGGTVEDVYGTYTVVDLNAGTINDDVFGHYISVDDAIGAGGTVYQLYLDGTGTGVDYNLFAPGTAPSYLEGHVSVGNDANYDDRQLQVYDAGVSTTNTYYGVYNYHAKTGGATGAGDDFYGIYNYVLYNDGSNIIDDLFSGYFETEIDAGTVSSVIGTKVLVDADGGAPGSIYAGMFRVNQDGSAVTANVYGVHTILDLSSGSIGNDVFGHYIWVDDDIGASTVHMIYLDEQTGVDYGIYQNGSAENRFGGIVNGNPSGVRTITSVANISDPPTDAELDAIFGTPAAVGDGFLGLIDDSGAGTHGVSVVTLNGAWWYGNLNKAT